MGAEPVIYCLEELSDYDQFERLCHDIMAGLGFALIEPLGGFHDKGRDAIHTSTSTGETTVFAYSVREDWVTKLREDASKIKKHGHTCDKLVFVTTARPSATERDRAADEIRQIYGWRLELFGIERLRTILTSTQSALIARHPQIFHPAFFGPVGAAQKTDLRIRVVPTRNRRHQLAQLRLFNAGTVPILLDGWYVEWGEGLDARALGSAQCVNGQFPLRLLEQSRADLLVSMDEVHVENLKRIGVTDAHGKHWFADAENVQQFVRDAIMHRPPPPAVPAGPTAADLQGIDVGITVRRKSRPGMPDLLEIAFLNKSSVPVPLGGACIEWEYDPPRGGPKVEGRPRVVETSGSVSLALVAASNIVPPGNEAVFYLRDEMSAMLVSLLAPDVPDGKISVCVGTTTKVGWRAFGDEVPVELRAAAQSVLAHWDRRESPSD